MLIKLGRFVIKNYKLVLLTALIITVVALYGVSKLRLQMQMKDMLPANEPEVLLLDYALENFKGMESVLMAVEGEREDIIEFINFVAPEIVKLPGVENATYKVDVDFFEKNGLLLVDETDDLDRMKGMLTAASLRDFVKGLNDNLETTYTVSGDSEKLSEEKMEMMMFLTTLDNFIGGFSDKSLSDYEIRENSNEFIRGPRYMISHDGTMGLVLIRTSINVVDMDAIVAMIDGAKGIIEQNKEKYNVEVGLAGNLAIQRDELYYTERDIGRTSVLSLVLILTIFYIGFRVIRYSLLAAVPLILGIIWVLGLTSFTIGSLNIFTSMMVAILIGLGIDYSIHVISIFTEMRNKGMGVEKSIEMVYEKVARGIVTGSVTTSLGFLIFMVSSFKAFKEFGFVLGSGILCTLLASIIVLPALLMVFHFRKVEVKDKIGEEISVVERFLTTKARFIIVSAVFIVIISLVAFPRVHFTKNWLDIEPVGMPSLETNERIMDKFDFSSAYSIFINKSLDEAARLKEKVDDLSTIGFVDTISQYVPEREDQRERMAVAGRIKAQVPSYVSQDIYPSQLEDELLRLEDNLIELSDLAYIGGEKKLVRKLDGMVESGEITKAIEGVGKDPSWTRKYQDLFISNLQKKIRNSNSSSMITLGDVPEDIRVNYIGEDGSFLSIAYPTEDPWEYDYQQIHLAQLESIKNGAVTGSVQLIIKVMDIAGREGMRVLFMTVIFIYFILLIDFRSFKYATFAMLPMGLTLTITLGIMGWFGITFNFVNILALPLIIGIGVDDGVHLIHRYLIEKDLGPAIRSTGRAITLTTLTTIAAFGALLIAKYRGFSSFARLISLGIGIAYLTTMILLPALITLFNRKKV
jgi:predicted RND superfamily exporter protein